VCCGRSCAAPGCARSTHSCARSTRGVYRRALLAPGACSPSLSAVYSLRDMVPPTVLQHARACAAVPPLQPPSYTASAAPQSPPGPSWAAHGVCRCGTHAHGRRRAAAGGHDKARTRAAWSRLCRQGADRARTGQGAHRRARLHEQRRLARARARWRRRAQPELGSA
jgi:hypothetical protein